MRYMLFIHLDESQMPKSPADKGYEMLAAYGAYNEALKKAGIYLAGDRLTPSATTTQVRIADGKTSVLDGPYAETREQIGGYYIIEAEDLDSAIAWAARCPGANHGTIEVRLIWEATSVAQ
ncbi:YciI family protein [Mesorhizobium sp. CGMCC 1.15528]|uniref:YciI family protein n=1 Tax=Mesorhizobium zhangyense TaxID=1776730 RepID=A0A7C9V9D1_9HYPH|nr:YciI family protein [Mesorhizobium zhangyense]NGN44105.1 YciI family protein [Mesorhizobium zhangyense]